MHIKLLELINFTIWAQRYSFFLNCARNSKKKCIYDAKICICKIIIVPLHAILNLCLLKITIYYV
jgi:hypothetical protein